MRRAMYIVVGCIGVVLSVVGAIVPILPAFPFIMLATFCFGKSSERLHNWFINTKLYKNNLESYIKGKGMTIKAKIRIILSITFTMGIGFLMMSSVPIGRIILAIVWVGHIIYFIFGVRTLKEDEYNCDINAYEEIIDTKYINERNLKYMFISQIIFEMEKDNNEMLKNIMEKKRSDVQAASGLLSFEFWWKEDKDSVAFSLVTKWDAKESFQKWMKESHAGGHKKPSEDRPKITKTGYQFVSID